MITYYTAALCTPLILNITPVLNIEIVLCVGPTVGDASPQQTETIS